MATIGASRLKTKGRWLAAAALLACVGAMGMRAPAAAADESPIGAHAMLQLNDPPSFDQAMFQEAAAMHASALRMDIAPAIVFSSESQPPDFSGLDRVMALAQQYHLRVVGDLFTVPYWIADCQSKTSAAEAVRCGTDDVPDYQSMISQIAQHADPVIRDWEIWNEPDSAEFFTGTPQQYARMLQAAHDAIKQVDPEANVLLGGISSTWGISWLAQVFATPGVDAAHDFDIANIHERGRVTALASDVRTWKQFLGGDGFSGPLWVTEHGYPSDPAYQYDPSYTSGEGAQAAYLTASIPTLLDAGASRVFVTERDNLGGQFASEGLLGGDVLDPPVANPQVVEKPSYAAVSALASCYEASGHACPGPAPVASPNSVTMPATRLGSSASSTVTISDPGSEPLQIGSLAIAVGSAAGISMQSDGCSDQIVEPDQTCSVTLAFAPTQGGTATASLQVPSDQGTLSVPVSGVAPSASSLTSPELASPTFKPVYADGVRYAQSLLLVLSNPLPAPVEVATAALSGRDATEFTILSNECAPTTLAPGDGCQLLLLFQPTRAGTASALLTVSGDGTPLEIPLHATAFPLPSISRIDLGVGSGCLTSRVRHVVSALIDQPSAVRWRVDQTRREGRPRCAAPAGLLRSGPGQRWSAWGRATTGQRERTVRGRRGYLATFTLPLAGGEPGLRPGRYRLTLVPISQHGVGAARSLFLTIVQ